MLNDLKKIKKYDRLLFAAAAFAAFLLLCGALKGYAGVPGAAELGSEKWTKNGPFELSSDRSRFALIYSFVENQSFNFSPELSDFALPDLVKNARGQFVTMFAPGVSFTLMPGYIIGRALGHSQLGAYGLMMIIAWLNFLLVRLIAIQCGASRPAAAIGALAFLFATPAFAYASTINQHHLTVFLLLLSAYLVLRSARPAALSAVFLLCSFSITVDNPNLIMLAPMGFFALQKIAGFKVDREWSINFQPKAFYALLFLLPPLIFFGWYNWHANLGFAKLSGTLPTVRPAENIQSGLELNPIDETKIALDWFLSRRMLDGFYLFFLSPDRGLMEFTPVILFGFWGLWRLYGRRRQAANLFFSVIGLNILLYAMWGDPQGGWAFGSRYLIPSYAMLAVCLPFALPDLKRNYVLGAIFAAVFAYSAWVNSLGALTSNANPPQAEILYLEKQTGVEQKYTWDRNRDFLKNFGSKSFVYNNYFQSRVSPETYHLSYVSIIMALFVLFFAITPASFKKAESGK